MSEFHEDTLKLLERVKLPSMKIDDILATLVLMKSNLPYKEDEYARIIYLAGIVNYDYVNKVFIWKLPLYASEKKVVVEDVADKISKMFKALNKTRGSSPASIRKKIADVTKHGEYTHDDILASAKSYIKQINDPAYLFNADGFIWRVNRDTRIKEYPFKKYLPKEDKSIKRFNIG